MVDDDRPLAYAECPVEGDNHRFGNDDCICTSLWLRDLADAEEERWLNDYGDPWD